MSNLLCTIWPYLVGALIGWLFAGLLARCLKYQAPSLETIIEKTHYKEKVIDNPEHMNLINDLKTENEQIQVLQNRIDELELQDSQQTNTLTSTESSIDNPIHLARIRTLEIENAQISGLRDRISDLENQLALAPTSNYSNKPGGLPSDADYTQTDSHNNATYQDKIKSLEEQLVFQDGQAEDDPDQAKGIGFMLRSQSKSDDFTLIEGIGPKVNKLIHADNIHSYGQLAQTSISDLQKILDNAGPNFRLADPASWPEQAQLAAKNEWSALKNLQDNLDGGRK